MKSYRVTYLTGQDDNKKWYATSLWLEGKTRNVSEKSAAFEYFSSPGAVLHRIIRVEEIPE